MKYCTGPIKNMYVKNMGVNEKIGEIVTESIVVRKNAPFYWNPLGRLVSFEYNTFLPTFLFVVLGTKLPSLSYLEKIFFKLF